MCQQNNNTKSKTGKHLEYSERQSIERWFNRDKRTKVEIAELLDRTEKTIRNKIKRGLVKNLTTENCTDNFTENCTDNEMKLLELLKINPNTTQVELSNKLNVSRRTISTLLANLKEKEKIERIGSDRKGYWKILK